ncbi:MAG: hypothetical protein M1820_008718 [Bogoriella megaspora]|nr:MAG: hypothetical protein M1820_008718 [Bogoriella megaspora]
MSGNLDTLSSNVQEKKQTVNTHNQELEALEARLRETEERLKVVARSQPASRSTSQRREAGAALEPSRSVDNADSKATDLDYHRGGYGEQDATPGANQDPRQGSAYSKRPSAAKGNSYSMPAMPGGLPDTPASHQSAKDYVMVDHSRPG